MKIAYCGNFQPSFSTETHVALTLKDMGHEVNCIQENNTFPIELIDAIGETDLFLFTRTWGETVTLEHLEKLKQKGIPTASFHLDLYLGLKRDGGLNSDAFWRTRYVFQPDGNPNCLEQFKQLGINAFYLPPGVYGPECYIADKENEITQTVVGKQFHTKVPEIIFVGSYNYHPEWTYRQTLIDWLHEKYGSRFGHFGGGIEPFPHTIRGDALNRLYASTKIVVGDSLCLDFNHPEYWSDRAAETTGRGGFLIHPRIKGMENHWIDGKEIKFYDYNNFYQLECIINYYLTHDTERENIRKRGHERTKQNHTYHHRMKKMLEIIAMYEPQIAEKL